VDISSSCHSTRRAQYAQIKCRQCVLEGLRSTDVCSPWGAWLSSALGPGKMDLMKKCLRLRGEWLAKRWEGLGKLEEMAQHLLKKI